MMVTIMMTSPMLHTPRSPGMADSSRQHVMTVLRTATATADRTACAVAETLHTRSGKGGDRWESPSVLIVLKIRLHWQNHRSSYKSVGPNRHKARAVQSEHVAQRLPWVRSPKVFSEHVSELQFRVDVL